MASSISIVVSCHGKYSAGCSLIALNWVQDILFAHDIEKIWGKLKCLTRNILSLLEIFWNSFQFTDSSCVWTKPFQIVLHHFCVLCGFLHYKNKTKRSLFTESGAKRPSKWYVCLQFNPCQHFSLQQFIMSLRWDAIASENVKYYELLRKSTQFLEQKESERNRLGEYWAQLHETLLLHVDSCGNNERKRLERCRGW